MTAALVAVAHGSRDPRAAATVEALLDLVRERTPVPVHTSYLDHAAPTPGRVLAALAGAGVPEAVVTPLLLTAAYHTKTDIPGVLARVARAHPRLAVRTAAALGPHPLLVRALERRLAEAGVEPGDPDTAVVLAAAGSSDPAANATIAALARRWRRRGWWDVRPGLASGAASASSPAQAVTALRAAGAPRVAVACYFLAPGHFADRVRHECGADVVAPVLGAAPELAELVLLRHAEALESARAFVAV